MKAKICIVSATNKAIENVILPDTSIESIINAVSKFFTVQMSITPINKNVIIEECSSENAFANISTDIPEDSTYIYYITK